MPYVNIRIAKGNVTAAHKTKLMQGATRLLEEVLNKDPKSTYVVIDEVDTDNWGVGGESLTAIRSRK